MSGTGHYDEITCMLYLDGQLETSRAEELATHAEGCGECRELLIALESESRLLERAMLEEEETVPVRVLTGAKQEKTTPWLWIGAAGLAAAGAYTLFTDWVNPWMDQIGRAGFGGTNLLAMLSLSTTLWEGWREMLTFIESVAVLSFIGVAAYFFRRTLKRSTSLAVMLASVAALLLFPQAGSAAETHRKVMSYSLASDKTVKNDLIVYGQSASIDGNVEGDVIFAGLTLTIKGHVTGDVLACGQRISIKGRVDGNVRGAGNTLEITGTVGKNVTVFMQVADIDRDAKIGGSLTVFVQNFNVDGRVERDLLFFSENAHLNGYVGGTSDGQGRSLGVGPQAELVGKATFKGHKPPEQDGSAKVAGGKVEYEELKTQSDFSSPRYYWHQALRWGGGFVFGMIWILLMPEFNNEMQRSAKRYGPALGVGFLTLVATPILAIIACITLVGMSSGIAALMFYIMAIYAGHVVTASWIGRMLLGESTGTGAALGRLALGLLIFRAVSQIPYIGGFIYWILVACLGIGALVLAIAGRMTGSSGPETTAPAVAVAA